MLRHKKTIVKYPDLQDFITLKAANIFVFYVIFSEISRKNRKTEETAKPAITNSLHTTFHIGNRQKPENVKRQSANQIFR